MTLQKIMNWLALAAMLALGIVWPPIAGAEPAPQEMLSGSLLLKAGADGQAIEAARVSTRIRAQVTGNVARVRVTQEFSNPTAEWVEGLYVFPLSPSAAVDELEMQIGERRIRGEIKRKEEARTTYEKAKSEGRRASLVSQERPNMFTTSVANIAPHSSVTVEIAYLDTIPYRDARYTLDLPLAITPRYTPGAGTEARATAATPERVTSSTQQVDIEVQLDPGFTLDSVRSLHHPVSMSAGAHERRVVLHAGKVPADRDFELVWAPTVTPAMQAAAFSERVGDETFVLLILTPPQLTQARVMPREVLFIIDTSGSMGGPSIEQARAALQLGITRLGPQDRFNVIRFSDGASSLFNALELASAANRALAERFIDSLHADGGTEMRSALELAFSMPADEEQLRQIVFITDGSVGNEAELVAMIHDRVAGARLFTVGIGAAPNAYFMREAAAAGRGSYTFIAETAQVRERMADLFRKLEQPALVDLKLRWPDGIQPELAVSLPGDVYTGDPLLVVARLPHEPRGLLTLAGQSSGGPWVHQVPIELVSGQPGIAKLWARERIAGLSRAAIFSTEAIRAEEQIVALALTYHLVSQYTSLVAVDVTPVRPIGAPLMQSQAPTSAPVGSYWAATTGFPSTATPAPPLFVIGFFALLFSLAMRRYAIRA